MKITTKASGIGADVDLHPSDFATLLAGGRPRERKAPARTPATEPAEETPYGRALSERLRREAEEAAAREAAIAEAVRKF